MTNASDDVAQPTSADFMERTNCIPDHFMPTAAGVIVLKEEIAGFAGYRPGSNRPRDWSLGRAGFVWFGS
jgi:hypothetical protein